MPATLLDLVNLAVVAAGQQPVMNLTENAVARTAAVLWPTIRRMEIGSHVWNFASKVAREMAATATTPVDWRYEHTLPADCLRMVEILGEGAITAGEPLCTNGDPGEWIPWTVRGGFLYSDQEVPSILYIADQETVPLIPEPLGLAMSYRLAAEISINLNRNPRLALGLEQRYIQALAQAKSWDGTHRRTDVQTRNQCRSMLTARG